VRPDYSSGSESVESGCAQPSNTESEKSDLLFAEPPPVAPGAGDHIHDDSRGRVAPAIVAGAAGGLGSAEEHGDIAAERGDLRAMPLRTGVDTWNLPDANGMLKYSRNNNFLGAHCPLGGCELIDGERFARPHGPGPCRLNRQVNKRPIGILGRWLSIAYTSTVAVAISIDGY
jgi:hypothetical protein